MTTEDVAAQFGMEIGKFKVARGAVTRFFQHVQVELGSVPAQAASRE